MWHACNIIFQVQVWCINHLHTKFYKITETYCVCQIFTKRYYFTQIESVSQNWCFTHTPFSLRKDWGDLKLLSTYVKKRCLSVYTTFKWRQSLLNWYWVCIISKCRTQWGLVFEAEAWDQISTTNKNGFSFLFWRMNQKWS